MSIIEHATDAVTDVNLAMSSDTQLGNAQTNRKSTVTTENRTNGAAHASNVTALQKNNIKRSLTPKEDSAQYATAQRHLSFEAENALCTSTTTMLPAGLGGSCVLDVIPESENSTTLRIDLRLPQGTAVHADSLRFYKLLAEIAGIHAKKQIDYGKENNPFANVRASEEWGIPGWVGAMSRLTDKIRRLQSLQRKGFLANESAEDSFRDIAVYALIAAVLYEQAHSSSRQEVLIAD